MAFMFETRFPQHLTKFAAELETLQEDYADCGPAGEGFHRSQVRRPPHAFFFFMRQSAHTRPRLAMIMLRPRVLCMKLS